MSTGEQPPPRSGATRIADGADGDGAGGEAGGCIFLADADRRFFTPTGHARGPWDPRALHGGAPAALIAGELERIEPGAELPIARLYFEFLRPVPLAPLELTTRVTRPGRRVQALEAELRAGDEVVCRARALRILAVPDELPASAALAPQHDPRDPATNAGGGTDGGPDPATNSGGAAAGGPDPAPLPGPERARPVRFALDTLDRDSFAATAIEMRFLKGGALGGVPHDRPPILGPADVWMRLRHPVLPGEEPSPLARVAAAADFGNGVSAVLPFGEYLFINADLSIDLDRRPRGEWIGLQSRTLLHPGGIGWAESRLHDEHGPLGVAKQTLVVQRR
ncbi:MAG TPA: thioesterase family protein [Solirubrobacteraceae bacterium]|nr:thioesterase family protein [Solirubrobacteraceae bacterium]